MKIFKNYTGSAFLNNALQTIEVLGDLNEVCEIKTDTLLNLYEKHKIWELFKRMKSYSMLFSRNGPLLNDKDFGDKIFKGIIEHTLNNFEEKGQYQCEISGLWFDTPFSKIYENVLHEIKYPIKKIDGKDKTINRCWFPLTGALGSDAQALPQATFEIKIHPICLVIIQFLPFSALLYKGGILLIDSIDFEFSKDYIHDNVKRVLQEIEITATNKSVENIRDFSQGDYILKALKIYSDKNNNYDGYSDLNLWSFSNSGTGASCYIDRIPNKIFKTLFGFYKTSKTQNDLVQILTSSMSNYFLQHLFEEKDFWGLYPRKIKNNIMEGVGVPFYDAYQTAIGNAQFLEYAKYIAYLIEKDDEKSNADSKLLEKSDAYKETEYNTLFYSVLLRATQNEEWSLTNHLEILDKTDSELINAWTYGIYKMTHYYYQKKAFLENCPASKTTDLTPVIFTIINLIEIDKERERSIKRLQHSQDYETFNINRVFVRNSESINLSDVLKYTYKDYHPNRRGLNKLLRLYYAQPIANNEFDEGCFEKLDKVDNSQFKVYQNFVEAFQTYYLEKYHQDTLKYEKNILKSFPTKTTYYKSWIYDVLNNMNKFYKSNTFFNKQLLETFGQELFYSPNGEYNLNFSRFVIQFLLNQHFRKTFLTTKTVTI
ncbi:hypothetical protein ACFFU9_01235 [Mariniflexile ostreae]|uniref:Uncharacterized protein n=1 Tax=Mariniflexile ostreae TaxID=1520892 RepID=A0ABV5F7D4_9FLAO